MLSQETLVEELGRHGVRFVRNGDALEVHGLSQAPAYLVAQFRAQKDGIIARYRVEHRSRPVDRPPVSTTSRVPNPYEPLLPPSEQIWPRKR